MKMFYEILEVKTEDKIYQKVETALFLSSYSNVFPVACQVVSCNGTKILSFILCRWVSAINSLYHQDYSFQIWGKNEIQGSSTESEKVYNILPMSQSLFPRFHLLHSCLPFISRLVQWRSSTPIVFYAYVCICTSARVIACEEPCTGNIIFLLRSFLAADT